MALRIVVERFSYPIKSTAAAVPERHRAAVSIETLCVLFRGSGLRCSRSNRGTATCIRVIGLVVLDLGALQYALIVLLQCIGGIDITLAVLEDDVAVLEFAVHLKGIDTAGVFGHLVVRLLFIGGLIVFYGIIGDSIDLAALPSGRHIEGDIDLLVEQTAERKDIHGDTDQCQYEQYNNDDRHKVLVYLFGRLDDIDIGYMDLLAVKFHRLNLYLLCLTQNILLRVSILTVALIGFDLAVEVSYIGIGIEVGVRWCLLRRQILQTLTGSGKLADLLLDRLQFDLTASLLGSSLRLLRLRSLRLGSLLRTLRSLLRHGLTLLCRLLWLTLGHRLTLLLRLLRLRVTAEVAGIG